MASRLYLILFIQQQMIKEVIFREVRLQINASILQGIRKNRGEQEGQLDVCLEVSFGNCYEKVHTLLDPAWLDSKERVMALFQKEVCLFCEGDAEGEMTISIKKQQEALIASTAKIQPSDLITSFQLGFLDSLGENIFEIQAGFSFEEKSYPVITLKNLACELKNNYNSSEKYRYLQVIVKGRKYRTKAVNHVLYWQRPIHIYVEGNAAIEWSIVEQQSGEKIAIPAQKIDHFPMVAGFRRVFIAKDFQMPKGCVQFYYETKGLRSQEDYERLAQLEENNQNQVLKLTIKTIKFKLKAPRSAISVRAFSGMNFVLSNTAQQESQDFTFVINKYLYLQSKENRCNFIIYSNDEVIGYGALMLNIIGFFDRRVGILSPETNKEIGYIMVSIQSEKYQSKSLQLAQLKLNLGEQQITKTAYFLSFFINGFYTRTEMRRIEQKTITFRRLILMKYTVQEQLDIVLSDVNNNEYCRAKVKLDFFKDCENQSFCKKVLKIRPEVDCSLEFICIYGDLNKININAHINTHETQAKQAKSQLQDRPDKSVEEKQKETTEPPSPRYKNKYSLPQQKILKQTLNKQNKQKLQLQFGEFQKSLINHSKNYEFLSNSSNSPLKLPQVLKKNSANLFAKRMYTSRLEKSLDKSTKDHYNSSDKQSFIKIQENRNTNKRLEQIYKLQLPILKTKGSMPSQPYKRNLLSESKRK